MKKILSSILFAIPLLLPFKAQAATFSDTVDFMGATHPNLHYTYQNIADNINFSWVHSLLDDLGNLMLSDIKFVDAELAVSYAKTEGNENWSLSGFGAFGKTAEPAVTSIFTLTPTQIAALQLAGNLTATLTEATTGTDTIRMIESRLSGHYELAPKTVLPAQGGPVNSPEASSFTSILLGLTGFFGANRAGKTRRGAFESLKPEGQPTF